MSNYLAETYFRKIHSERNENAKLRKRIMELELEVYDLRKKLKGDVE